MNLHAPHPQELVSLGGRPDLDGRHVREMPERIAEVAKDSRYRDHIATVPSQAITANTAYGASTSGTEPMLYPAARSPSMMDCNAGPSCEAEPT